MIATSGYAVQHDHGRRRRRADVTSELNRIGWTSRMDRLAIGRSPRRKQKWLILQVIRFTNGCDVSPFKDKSRI